MRALQGQVQTSCKMMVTVEKTPLLPPLHLLYEDGSLTRRCAGTSGTRARTGSALPQKSGLPQPGATVGPARRPQWRRRPIQRHPTSGPQGAGQGEAVAPVVRRAQAQTPAAAVAVAAAVEPRDPTEKRRFLHVASRSHATREGDRRRRPHCRQRRGGLT